VLAPNGFTDAIQFVRTYLARVCREFPAEPVSFLSIGAGTCSSEINIAEWLRENGIENYTLECADINPRLVEKGRALARQKNLLDRLEFAPFDVNRWKPARQYHAIVAFQSLHHFVELEVLFDKIHTAMHPAGYFLTDDMIGRNGHQRWPEALKFVNQFWRELPQKYTYNHQLKRFEKEYENWDCSKGGFEGIRAQDILPLLIDRFNFELFIVFGNVIDIFIDRGFGPNFDPSNEWDCAFIDRVHALDTVEIEAGRLKPTHMIAAMTKRRVERIAMHKHLSPAFCVRRPN
jgi:SAM-dependent methyltransferase